MKRYDSSEIDRMTKTDRLLYTLFTASLVGGGIALATLSTCSQQPKCAGIKSHYTAKDLSYIKLFKRHKVENPTEMGLAIAKTKNPPLMAAISLIESNADVSAVGDSGLSKGAFQVQEMHWGYVSSNASEQASQAEGILEELLRGDRRRSLRSALAKYNGGDRPPKVSFRYASRVLKKAKEIQNGHL